MPGGPPYRSPFDMVAKRSSVDKTKISWNVNEKLRVRFPFSVHGGHVDPSELRIYALYSENVHLARDLGWGHVNYGPYFREFGISMSNSSLEYVKKQNSTRAVSVKSQSIDNTRSSYFDASTPEKLAEAVVTSLSHFDGIGFINFAFIDKDELIRAIILTEPDEEKEKIVKEINEEYTPRKNFVLASWYNVYQDGSAEGIDWESTRYESSSYKIKEEKNGIKVAKIYIVLRDKDAAYTLELKTCALIKDEWRIVNKIVWKGKKRGANIP